MTVPLKTAAQDFLSRDRIAVVGVSRDDETAPGSVIYRKLRELEYDVAPVNPSADRIDGEPCYRSVAEVPGELDGVVIATPPGAAGLVARACVERGVPRVWIHGTLPPGSVTTEAQAVLRDASVSFIAGGCPMMHCRDADLGHRCMRWVMGLVGKLPREVEYRE
jgi:predicted CoA-binding protein